MVVVTILRTLYLIIVFVTYTVYPDFTGLFLQECLHFKMNLRLYGLIQPPLKVMLSLHLLELY